MSENIPKERKIKMSTVDSYNPSESTFIGAPSSSLAYDLKNNNIKSPSSNDSVVHGHNSSTILESENINYTIDSNPEEEFGLPTSEMQKPANEILQVLTFDVKENEQSKTITIGRSSSKNDFQLSPKSALISRQHLAVTYFPNSNTLRIKCYGKNGLVVNFPKLLNYKLIRQLKEKVYELVPVEETSLNDDHEKEIIKKKGITSFVLNQKEICFIPFMSGLQFGFGQLSLELKIKHSMAEQEAKDVEHDAQDQNVNKNEDQSVLLSSPLSSVVEYNEDEEMTNKEVIQNLSDKLKSNENSEENEITAKKLSHKRAISEIDESHGNSHKKQKTVKSSTSTLQDLMKKIEVEKIIVKEVVHQLTNQIAFASIQQIPLKQLYESNSTCSSKLSLPEFRVFLDKFLLKLEPSIQIILRKGKDAAGKLLDPEFFYDVEKDSNEERVLIVSNLKGGRSGLRSCRKVHKQYFWKKPTK
ncbi:uncharacterized protein HGUI_01761 [Hanseniaspora guilliermondii]|uniref:FHA domain-containing protein n=1 Tax=Hanseniaspora guilliermondii TaxID=56406 RepID=A0A1L0CME2_9ASCO|nr:uncharacterized protein HGUI_01761 [Hanseniaspora guilliermondii]